MTAPVADQIDDVTEHRPSTLSAVLAGIIVVLLVAVMTNLGFWQLRRHAEVREQNVQILARSSNAVPIGDVDFSAPVDDWDFQLVEVTAQWVPDEEVLWRGRNRNGIPGFEILTPFANPVVDCPPTAGCGTTGYLVDRGFLPDTFTDVPASAATPPEGDVTITAIARPSIDQPGFGPKDPVDGELDVVFHADVSRLDGQVTADLVDEVYLRLVSAVPATESDALRPLPPIEPDAGNHLGYALQWFGFSLTAIVAYLAWLWTRSRRRLSGR